MKMEIDLETMLDIALGGPEIGPLNLQVLHGLMRDVFQRINISNQKILVEDENTFCNSFNFIKSKLDENDRRPSTAGGGNEKFKSKVSVIVSDYVRTPIGAIGAQLDEKQVNDLSIDVEERLRLIESELKNAKDFPSIDDLRNWAKEKSSPDTVVTDLWHFVSLNHRVSGLEEGIQKLSTLVDRLIPELKALGNEQNNVNGKIDNLYSQFKGLSDRLSLIDNKVDSSIANTNAEMENKVDNILTTTKRIEKRFNEHPKYPDLDKLVTNVTFNEVQARANTTVGGLREEIAGKLNVSVLDKIVSQDDLQHFVENLNAVNAKMIDCVRNIDLERYVPITTFNSAQEKNRDMKRELIEMNITIANKADVSALSNYAVKGDIHHMSIQIEDLMKMYKDQSSLSSKVDDVAMQIKKKADNDDIVDVLKKEDMKKTINKVQNHQNILTELQSWHKTFIAEENPILINQVNDLALKSSEIKESLSALQDLNDKKPWENIDLSSVESSVESITRQISELENTTNKNISSLSEDVENKLNKVDLKPLKDYLENCYEILAKQLQDTTTCNHPTPTRPKSAKPSLGTPSFVLPKSDAAVMKSQMRYNCLACNQSMHPINCQFQTIRGRPMSAYELDHLKVLHKMLDSDEGDNEGRPCGGEYTTSTPTKKTGRASGRTTAFGTQDLIMVDGEVDIEGLDGKLYRGLISRKDYLDYNRCKSAGPQIRTVSPKPGTRSDRPISAKNLESRSFNLPRATNHS